jgi:predicted secreted Zn-dependent protease
MKSLLLSTALLAGMALPVAGASLSKTYSYFTIGGSTLEEIEKELRRHGPQVSGSGTRHPGATRMEFTTRIGYGERGRFCSVVEATVLVEANMILPRWKRHRGADFDTRFIWGTLSADIKRHEESHVIIAKNHARELEQALEGIVNERSCERAQKRARDITDQILAKHDKAQDDFDRIEGVNFESRLLRLMRYRLDRIEAGR